MLVQRGPRDDTACPLPHAYFANKIKRVQDAGAVGVVMANNVEGSLVFMGAVSGDHATRPTRRGAVNSVSSHLQL